MAHKKYVDIKQLITPNFNYFYLCGVFVYMSIYFCWVICLHLLFVVILININESRSTHARSIHFLALTFSHRIVRYGEGGGGFWLVLCCVKPSVTYMLYTYKQCACKSYIMDVCVCVCIFGTKLSVFNLYIVQSMNDDIDIFKSILQRCNFFLEINPCCNKKGK